MFVKLKCEYNGRNFLGFQRLSKGRSVQGVLEDALSAVLDTKIQIVGSGRTDAGVHAREQFCSFQISNDHKILCSMSNNVPKILYKLCGTINAYLAEHGTSDLVVHSIEEAPDGFNARHDVKMKMYLYRTYMQRHPSPIRDEVYAQIPDRRYEQYDINRMCEDAKKYLPDKQIVIRMVDDELWFMVSARGFEYKEVRKIVGKLLYPAKNFVAPAKGLTLFGVEY